jgi:hypothetical protein
MTLGVDRQQGTRVHGLLVEEHAAGAALGAIADALGPGQVEVVAQSVEQRDPRLQLRRELSAVDVESDRGLSGTIDVHVGAGGADDSRADHDRYRRRDARDLEKFAARDAAIVFRGFGIVISHARLRVSETTRTLGSGRSLSQAAELVRVGAMPDRPGKKTSKAPLTLVVLALQ